MSRLRIAGFLVAISLTRFVHAHTQEFTSQTAFAAATRDPTVVGFNSFQPGSGYLSFETLTVSGITFSSPVPGVNVNINSPTYYTVPSRGGYPPYSANYIVNSINPGNNQLVITFSTPTNAVALDYGGLGFRGAGGATMTLSNGYVFTNPLLPTEGSTTFVGFVSTDQITSLTFSTVNDDWIVLDVILANAVCVGDTTGMTGSGSSASPCITSPADNAHPQSQFVALAGTGAAGDRLDVLVDGSIVGTVTVDSEGNWEALPWVAAYGPSPTVQVQDESSQELSNTITVVPLQNTTPGPGTLTYTRLLPLRGSDILTASNPSSPQKTIYGATNTHVALYLGGDSNGTPIIAEAVTRGEARAAGVGQVRSLPLESSLIWDGSTRIFGFRPVNQLSGATRSAVVSWARSTTMLGLKYGPIEVEVVEIIVADEIWTLLSVLPVNYVPVLTSEFDRLLNDVDTDTQSTKTFICSTFVWRAYLEGTGHSLNLSTPNNMRISGLSFLNVLPNSPTFVDQLRPVFIVPDTFATSPKLRQIF